MVRCSDRGGEGDIPSRWELRWPGGRRESEDGAGQGGGRDRRGGSAADAATRRDSYASWLARAARLARMTAPVATNGGLSRNQTCCP